MFDIIIKNGHIIDGTGNPAFRADLGITDRRVIAIQKFSTTSAETVIDATGRVVCPGFIDLHAHSDIPLLINPKAGAIPSPVETKIHRPSMMIRYMVSSVQKDIYSAGWTRSSLVLGDLCNEELKT